MSRIVQGRELILGGARSGKSRLAEQRALHSGASVCYIATATAGDSEMTQRINIHRQQRPENWLLVEEPIALAAALQAHAAIDRCIIVACLTLWLSNLLGGLEGQATESDSSEIFVREREALVAVLPTLPGQILLVSNELGMGVVPMGALTRRYCDEVGRLHQQLAQLCERVTWVIAGLAQTLKGDA